MASTTASISPDPPDPSRRSRAWTDDPLENVLLLPQELIDQILKELAEAELDQIAQIPTGEFTWRPHLACQNTEFSKQYMPILGDTIKETLKIEMLDNDGFRFSKWTPAEMLWFMENCTFYGPVDNTERGQSVDPPGFRYCPINYGLCDHSTESGNCHCRASFYLSVSFTSKSDCHGTSGPYRKAIRYAMDIKLELRNDIGQQDKRGLRHRKMWIGSSSKHALFADGLEPSQCPCCQPHARQEPVLAYRRHNHSLLTRYKLPGSYLSAYNTRHGSLGPGKIATAATDLAWNMSMLMRPADPK